MNIEVDLTDTTQSMIVTSWIAKLSNFFPFQYHRLIDEYVEYARKIFRRTQILLERLKGDIVGQNKILSKAKILVYSWPQKHLSKVLPLN